MSVINHQLNQRHVLVTGATGFIGGRLAERLALEEGAVVTGTGRDLSKVPFVAAAGVRLVKADLLNHDDMAAALAGQEVVFHIAASLGAMQDAERAQRVNVDATRDLVRLAAAAGVRRIVYTSSMTAYGPPHGVMHESLPVDTEQEEAYGRTKAAGELALLAAGTEYGVEVSIIRPGLVYGPRSASWTVRMLELVDSGLPVIFGKGDGYATPVYIDNLIDMLLLAALRPEAVGEAFNAVDRSITWREWFGYYGKMLGKKPRRMPMPVAHVLAWATETFKLRLPLTRHRLKFYRIKTVYPIDKARALLGYEPRITLDEGMRRSEAWLREVGKI